MMLNKYDLFGKKGNARSNAITINTNEEVEINNQIIDTWMFFIGEKYSNKYLKRP